MRRKMQKMFLLNSPLVATIDFKVSLRDVIFASGFGLVLCCTNGFSQQAGGVLQGRNLVKQNGPLPAKGVVDARKMELEERRRLRQEIQRHGPDYRVRDGAPVATPSALSGTALAVTPPLASPTNAPVLPPASASVGYPSYPGFSSPAPAAASMLPSPPPRGAALTQEERHQLRQQIREERRRGAFPTPSEVDR
jgi:hypothetical protein